MLKLYNTLTKREEDFVSIKKGVVGMYNCGPTVYDYVHIGNLRSYVFADILRRVLEWNGYKVDQVINITDFGHLSSDADEGEDKMLKGLKREGIPLTLGGMQKLAHRYTKSFKEDLEALNIQPPTSLPYASNHIPQQIDIIKGLEEKGFTYTTSDGVYFDTSKDASYGKLGGLSDADETQARVQANAEKKNKRDFALWKFDDKLGWDSPWGKGFPGWHIECSAMSMKYLGSTFDIHTGGIDHIPIHHNNEIAQSDNFAGHPVVRHWLHHEFVTFNKNKMAKSAGGFIKRKDLEEKGIEPLVYRYWLLMAHYRTPVEFSWEALEAANHALKRIKDRIRELGDAGGTADEKYLEQFTDAINSDLDTPSAIVLLWSVLKDDRLNDAAKKATIMKFDTVLGLELADLGPLQIPIAVQKLIDEREEAREKKNWEKADALRKKIEEQGYKIKDSDAGPSVVPF